MKAGITVVKDPLLAPLAPIHLVDEVMTIGRWLELNGVEPNGMLCCRGDNDFILRRDFDTYEIVDGDAIVIMPLPLQGGGNGGNSALQIVLTIIIAVLAYYTGGAASALLPGVWGTALGAVVSAVILVAGSYMLSAIFAPDSPDTDSNSYQISNQQNLARIGSPIPVLYGRFRFYPDLIAKPYSETFNDSTWLYMFMCLTQGHCEVHEIRIEDTPLSKLHRSVYKYEIYPPGYEGAYMFPVSVVPSEAISNIELVGNNRRWREITNAAWLDNTVTIPGWFEPWSGPHILTDRGVAFSDIAMDFQFTKGLVQMKDGDAVERGCGISVQLREIGYDNDEPTWTYCFIDPTFFDNGTAFTAGNAVAFANRGYFYVYFDHHPGFLTKRVEADDVQGDYDKVKYARNGGHWKWVDNERPETKGPFEFTQTINITGWEADVDGLVGGSIPLEKLEGTDLQVIDLEMMAPGAANSIASFTADDSKMYYRAMVLLPTYEGVVNTWQEGASYVEGDYAGRGRNTGAYPTTSTTSVTIVSIGNVTLTIDTGLLYRAGMVVLIDYDETNNMTGRVVSYHAGTGALVVEIQESNGAGTYAAWSVEPVEPDDSMLVQCARCKKPHTAEMKYAPPRMGVVLKTGVPGSPPAYNAADVYNTGDYVVQGSTIYQYRYATSGTAPTPGSGPGWATYWSSDLYWRHLYGTSAQADQIRIGSRFNSTYYFYSSSGDSNPEGFGGKSLKYSKWYNVGEALETDWTIPHDQITGAIVESNLVVTYGPNELYESFNLAGTVTGYDGNANPASGAVVKLETDTIVYASSAPTPIPPATIVFRAHRQSPFVKTVKASLEDICDELTTLDEYGNKRDEAPWVAATTYSLGDKVSYRYKNYEYIHATPASGYNPEDESRWKFHSYILQRSKKKFGRFEGRFRQTGRERFETDTRFNNVVLNSVKLYLPERRSYGDITTMCLKLQAGYTLNSSTKNKVNVEATRKLPIYRGSGSVAVASNGFKTVKKYGVGCVEVTFNEDVTYAPGELVDFTGVVESGGSAIEFGGIPAAMLSGKKVIVARTGARSYLVMLEKVVRLRSTTPRLRGGVVSTTAPAWSGATAYVVGEMAYSGSKNYRCIQNHTNKQPAVASGWASYWTELSSASYTVLTLADIEMEVGSDGPDNLTGLGLRVMRNGVYRQAFYGSDVFDLTVEHQSADVMVHWPSHGFSTGDDFTFSNVPDSVPSISGVSALIWEKQRHEDGSKVGNDKYPTLMRVAHVVTRVVDSDNFAFTLRGRDKYIDEGDVFDQVVKIPNAAPIVSARVEYETSGGKHYAAITKIPAWAASTAYSVSYLVVYLNTTYRCVTAHTSGSTFDSSKWSTTLTSGWETATHTPSARYVGGRVYLTPPNFVTQSTVFKPGEWCRHVYAGDPTQEVRYYRRIGTGNVLVDVNGTYTTAEEPGYPASTKWQEFNRAASGTPTWYFDIVAVDGTRYEISSPGNPQFTEFYGATTQQLGVACSIQSNYFVELGNTVSERMVIAKPVEYSISRNTATVVALDGANLPISSGDNIEIVLTGGGVTDAASPTQQTNVSVDIGGPPGWSDTGGRTWNVETTYIAGDRVKLGRVVYLCVLGNTGTKPPNTTYWKEDSEQFFPTKSIAWATCDMLRSSTYGGGVPTENIGVSDLMALDNLWMGRGAYSGTDRDPAPPEQWIVDHAYFRNGRVRDYSDGRVFLCLQDHTSATGTRPGTSGSYGYWEPTTDGVPDTVSGVFDKQSTLWNALAAALGTGRAAPTIKHGSVVTAVRDDYKEVPRQMFSDRNIVAGSMNISYQTSTDEEHDSLSLKFINEKLWTEDSVLAFPADDVNPRYYCKGYQRGNTLYAAPVTWDSSVTYRRNEYVSYSGDTWISLQDSNTNHTPESGAWWDVADEIFVPENTMDSILWDDGKDVLIISYIDSSEVVVSVMELRGTPGDPLGFTLLKGTHQNPVIMEGWGFTARKQAWREAKFRVDATRNRRAKISFTVEKEGLIASYGDRVIVTGLWGQSGDIVNAEQATDGNTYIELDRDLSFKDSGVIPYALQDDPIQLLRGSREVIVHTENPHRLNPGIVVVVSGILGASYTFMNASHSVHRVVDEYSFVVLKDTAHSTADSVGGGVSGSFYVNYDGNVLNVVMRKPNGSVFGPMAVDFWRDPSHPDYFRSLLVDTSDLTDAEYPSGFVPVFDTDKEKTHYLIGMSNSFRRDCKIIDATPREHQVDITVVDDGDNSHYESDHTYRYVSDIDTDVVRQANIAPSFDYEFDADGVPISVVNVSVGGTAAAPTVTVSWRAARGASLYIVQYSDVESVGGAYVVSWDDLDRTSGLSTTRPAPVGRFITFRVIPVGYGEGPAAYFSGVARFDGNYRSTISFPGSIMRTGANVDIEPLDDEDVTTIAAGSIRKERTITGTKNGFNRHFDLPSRAIKNDEISVEFGTPQSILKHVPTRLLSFGALASTTVSGSNSYTHLRIYRGGGKTWAGIQAGDRVRLLGAQGVFLNSSALDVLAFPYAGGSTYNSGNYVGYGAGLWRCVADGTSGVTPGTDTTKWVPLSDKEMVVSGENLELEAPLWVAGTTYYSGEVVRDADGNKYSAIQTAHVADATNAPPNSEDWLLIPDGYEVVDTYSVASAMKPSDWTTSTSYTTGDLVSSTANGYLAFLECERDHTSGDNSEPFVGPEWSMWWNEISADDLDDTYPTGYGAQEIIVDIGQVEFEPGFSNTAAAAMTFDGSPAPGEPSTVLPSRPFVTTPFQDRVFVFDPTHGKPDGFCDSLVAFTYESDPGTICGLDKDFVVMASSDFASTAAPNYHEIYVLDSDWYYFIPKKADGTRLTDAQVPRTTILGGSVEITRYFLPRVAVTRTLTPNEFTANATRLTLGVGPNRNDELTATYASRT